MADTAATEDDNADKVADVGDNVYDDLDVDGDKTISSACDTKTRLITISTASGQPVTPLN